MANSEGDGDPLDDDLARHSSRAYADGRVYFKKAERQRRKKAGAYARPGVRYWDHQMMVSKSGALPSDRLTSIRPDSATSSGGAH